MAATPKDNTEVVRMLRDVKNSLWKTITPLKDIDKNFDEYISSFPKGPTTVSNFLSPDIATKLNFSSMDDSHCSQRPVLREFETPESLKRKLMITEAELQTSKAKLKECESKISVLEPAKKKLCVDLEMKIEKYKQQTLADAQTIEELNGKLRWAKGEATHAKNLVHENERKKKVELDKMELQLVALKEEISNLKTEVADIKSDKAETVRKLHIEIGRLEMKVSMLSDETRKSEEHIQLLKRQKNEFAEKAALCNSLETQLKDAQSTIKSLQNKIEADIDASFILASRQSDLKLLKELQKENRMLKEDVAKNKENNIALFQEKIWSYQEKLKQAEIKNVAFSVLQAENEKLKSKLAQWEDLFDDKSTSFKSPTAFSRKLSQYQKNEAVLTNKVSQLANHCNTLEKQKKDMEETIKNLNYKIQQFQCNSPRQDSLIKRLQRKVIFLAKEREYCRKLLDSYLSESTMPIGLNVEHVSHLEELNMEYKNALEKCEKEVDNLNEEIKKLTDHNAQCSASDLKKLREENASHLSVITRLQEEKTLLEQNHAFLNKEQEQNAWGGKILHLQFNPLDNANKRHIEAFHKLQEENDALKKRIKVLEEEGVAAADVTMKVKQRLMSEGADSTLKTLKQQLAAAERKQKFILENARIKSTEFRQAVYNLFGYRIDVPTAEKYKLSHVYAESKDDYLLFQINSEGIQLIETEYSKQLTDRVELYLRQHDSFPAFFASLTMDLFSQQTYMLNQ